LDDEVMGSLEKLNKTQSAEVTEKMASTDQTLAEVDSATDEYRPFASARASVYFTLENLGRTQSLYQHSLNSSSRSWTRC
jgi:hypothetical protein